MPEEIETLSEETEKSKIVNASMYIDALKSSGYKSTYNAIAEIVDNSIDAEASDIFIIGKQAVAGNGEKKIVSFAFLDNGRGMDYATLKGCLTIGFTTNQERKGMGRFGVGLPQASVFVCNRVEVYSWQNGIENCKKVYLDVDEV
ncbi:MAG: ATP-binding protein, partial [Bacilli bacterium]|nr:ATP-binding protein [Bacilli bacterium]